MPIVVGLAVAFALLLAAGLTLPCMALRLDMDTLEKNLHMDDSIKSLVNGLGLPALAQDDVSYVLCIKRLSAWVRDGQLNSIIALVMLVGFVLLFTVLDVSVLILAAFQLCRGQLCKVGAEQKVTRKPCFALAVSRVLGKLSMLDVSIMGVVVVVLSGAVYRSKGIILSMQWGLLALLGAELCHYALYYTVFAVAQDHSTSRDVDIEKDEGIPSDGHDVHPAN